MAHKLVHLDFSLYFWCLILTPFQLQAASVKDKQKKEKSHITGSLSNLVLHHACFKWEHGQRCAVSSLEMLTLLFSLEWNPTSHVPLFLWHPNSVRKTQTKGVQGGMKWLCKCLIFPWSSQWSDKILMVVYPGSFTELVKALLCMLLP